MKPTYNKAKIMRGAWYMFRTKMYDTFAHCLRAAWANERRRNINAMIEGRNLVEEDAAEASRVQRAAAMPWCPVAVPAGYYGNANTYYGD